MTGARRAAGAAVLALLSVVLVGCARTVGDGDPDVEAARTFDGYPLYWVGEHFEQWDLEYVAVRPGGLRDLRLRHV